MVFHQEEEDLPCTMITLFKESCLHVHANLRSPNFDTQNSTKMFGIMWQACMFELIFNINLNDNPNQFRHIID